MILFWLLLFTGLCLLPIYILVIFLYHLFTDKKEIPAPALAQRTNFETITNEKVQLYLTDDLVRLKDQGELMYKSNIDSAYFIHGTFVGDDPFHILNLLEQLFPKLPKSILKKIKSGVRDSMNLFAKDLGNFSHAHFELFENITHHKVKVYPFGWSSANNHLARIQGVIDLIADIYEKNQTTPSKKILLIGHSHAGQIFALLSKIISNEKFRSELELILTPIGLWPGDFDNQLNTIREVHFDFVTLGTPARYSWELSNKMRLLHFINHRGTGTRGGELRGVFTTKSGDYIQQWGGAGSDMISLTKSEQNLNKSLDKILGSGSDFTQMKENVLLKNRLHNQGHHLLVDYNDQSVYPNFLKTIFGHGVYTKISHFAFHLSIINDYFYKETNDQER